MQMNFWMKFFVTCSKKYLNISQCIKKIIQSLLNKCELKKVCKFLIDSMFHLEKW
jgi:hypothetical protein